MARRIFPRIAAPSYIVVDPKCRFDPVDWQYVYSPEELAAAGNKGYTHIVYWPDPEYMNLDSYQQVLWWIYLRGNTAVYVTELYGLMEGRDYPDALRAIITRGRELGITFVGETQRPAWVPLYTISEAENYYVFQLNVKEDRQRIASLCGPELLRSAEGFEFFFYTSNVPDFTPTLVKLEL